ncbi:AMIN domain-containing protein [Arenimonas daejeonensis]|uniref:AMIN domain-containing protein n=1 Tax=Arenimonas daejeonensis TaxID=370777 RepID=UPI001D13A861|nr:AMIN domain-containing protein [Arenimonas daejeonensis]
MRRNLALLLIVSTLLGLAASGAQAAQLKGVTLVEGETGTRAVLELTDTADYKLFTLSNPDRLVLDLSGSSLAGGYKAPAPNGVVAGVRTGKPADNQLRVVLDLGREVKPRSRIERHGNSARLVLELFTDTDTVAGKPAPARTVQDVIGTGQRKLIIAIDAGHGGRTRARSARPASTKRTSRWPRRANSPRRSTPTRACRPSWCATATCSSRWTSAT